MKMEWKRDAYFGENGRRDPDGSLLCDIYAGAIGARILKECRNIEEQIEDLECDEFVKLAQRFKRYKQMRLDRLQELKELKREGIRLHDAGWKEPEADDDAET